MALKLMRGRRRRRCAVVRWRCRPALRRSRPARSRSRRSRFSATTRRRGEVGGAVQSRVFSVGNGVLWAEADVGIVTTQAIVDVSYGPKALALLRAGMTPAAIIKAILDSDPDPGYRGQPWPKAGPAVRRDGREGRTTPSHTGPKATDVGRPQGRQVLHRAGQHPRGRSGRRPAWWRPSRRPQGTCRCG